MIPRGKISKYLKQVLLSETFDAFLCSSVVNKVLFCLGEMKGMLVNNECSLWYSRVGDFLCWFGLRKWKFCMVVDQPMLSLRPTPLQRVKPMALMECYGS